MRHWVIWGSVACIGFMGCGGDDDAPPEPEPAAGQGWGGDAAGRGGEGGSDHVVGPAGAAGEGGSAGVIVVGGGAGKGGGAGEGGGAGAPVAGCEQGLQRLRIVSDAGLPELAGHRSVTGVVSWPEQQRIAVNLSDQIAIFDLEPAEREGTVRLVQLLDISETEIGAPNSFRYIFPDGDGLIAITRRTDVLSWQPEAGFSYYTGASYEGLYQITGALADATHGLILASPGSLDQPMVDPRDGEWGLRNVASAPGRRVLPLAFDGDTLLAGVGEIAWGEPGYGAGGASAGGGGEAGATFGPDQARLERWSLAGERLASYGTTGDPSVAVPARGGWLIGETNSYLGSYQAAIHWLSPTGKLKIVVHVPVQSSGDGIDGAYDVALHGDDLLVANCESGLLRGRWEANAPANAGITLKPVPGPWSPDFGECSPKHLEVVGDVMVVAGPGLDFVRFCE
jgi:hypothetical protein